MSSNDSSAMIIDDPPVSPPTDSSILRARSSSATAPKPKGILKNPSSDVTSTLSNTHLNSHSHTSSQPTASTHAPVSPHAHTHGHGHERTSTADITAANTAYNTPLPSTTDESTNPFSNASAPSAAPTGTIASRRGVPTNLTWDEENLQAAAAQGGGKMKITEPKTPYVRYNAETDEVENMEDIPNFELGDAQEGRASGSGSGIGSGSGLTRSPASNAEELPAAGSGAGGSGVDPTSSGQPISLDNDPTTNPARPPVPSRSSSRSVSIHSSSGRGSSSRRESRGSEPPTVDFDTEKANNGVGGSALDTSDGEDEDDESTWDPAKREQHEKFAALRNRHYSNEAEAMKRAQELMKRDEEDEDEEEEAATEDKIGEDIEITDDDDDEDNQDLGKGPNGTTTQPNGVGKHRVPPPVPQVPDQYRS